VGLDFSFLFFSVNAKMSADKNVCQVAFLKDLANKNFRDRCSRQTWHEFVDKSL
jgi:hypothetical protein